MGCDVYANGDAIACKAGDGKVIAAFPDVCLTPPPPPAGPIPVPYPNTSFSKDMKKGSKKVKIKGKEVMLKDSSFYKSSPLGDEAATNGQGAGVVTHVITGKTYFVAWSMDVKFEGQNVDRHTDITTSNHASPMANATVPLPDTETASTSQEECPHTNIKRDPPKGRNPDYPEPPGTSKDRHTRKLEKRANRLLELAAKAEMAGNLARSNAIWNRCLGISDNVRGSNFEKKVADETEAKERSVKVICADCGRVLAEFDVVTKDGIAKECKISGAAVDEGQFLKELKYAQLPQIFGPGTIVHIALPRGERKNVSRISDRAKPKMAGQFQEH